MRAQASRPALTPEQQRLVLDQGRLVRNLTLRYARKYRNLMSEDDIAQWIQVGLAESARSWDRSANTPFGAFAWKRISGLIADAVHGEVRQRDIVRRASEACMEAQRDEGELEDSQEIVYARTERLAARISTAIMLGLVNEDSGLTALEDEDAMAERDFVQRVKRALRDMLRLLSVRRQRLLELYYVEERDLKEVALLLQIGYSSARREHNEALDELAEMLNAQGLTPTG